MSRLAERLAVRIAREGPIGIDVYMDACLHDPSDGYYATRPALGAEGDFITAPHVSQMFGELLGAWAAEVWSRLGRPARIRLVELGPGDGAMITDVLRAARSAPGFLEAMELVLLETSALLRARQAERLDARWIARPEEIGEGAPIIFLANEFLDCLPIRQAEATHAGWRERRVGADGERLVFTLGDEIAGPQGAPAGTIVEWSSEAERLAANTGALIARTGGAALFIDYAGDGVGDTLQAVRGHRREGPLDNPGEADITARVNFVRFLAASPARTHGPVAQGAFLRALGLEARAAALALANPDQAAKIGRQSARLADAGQMGELFQVACIASPGLTPPGLA